MRRLAFLVMLLIASPAIGQQLRLSAYDTNDNLAFGVYDNAGITINNVPYTFPADDGDANQVLQSNGSGALDWATVTTAPAGSNTHVQYNNNGVFGGDAGMTYNATTDVFTLSPLVAGNLIAFDLNHNVDPGSGSTQMWVRNTQSAIYWKCFGSTYPGVLADSVGLFTDGDFFIGPQLGGELHLFANQGFSAPHLTIDLSGNIEVTTGDIVFTEKADHTSTPAAGYGYLWTKSTSPSTLMFTDDDGTDWTLNATVAPVNAQYVTLAADATLTDERVLTGTANEVTVTDGGAGSNVTLSLPSGVNLGDASYLATDEVRAYDSAGLKLYEDGGAGIFVQDSTGFVGVGTTAPDTLLHVDGGLAKVTRSGAGAAMIVHRTDGLSASLLAGTLGSAFQFDANGYFSLQAATEADILAGNGTGTDRLYVKSTGEVGIGTNNPQRLLQVHQGTGDYNQIAITNTDTGATGNDGLSIGIDSSEMVVIYQRENNHMQFRTNNTDRVRITNAGNVGIASTAPDKPLEINAATGGAIRLTYNDSNGSASTYVDQSVDASGLLQIDTSGNGVVIADGEYLATDEVRAYDSAGLKLYEDGGKGIFVQDSTGYAGFGTAGPEALLHLSGSDAYQIQERAIDTVSGAGFSLRKARGTPGSEAIVQDGDTLAGINVYGYDGVDYNSNAASILFEVDGTPGSNDMPGRIVFKTALDNSSTPLERMRITSNNRFGLLTDNPSYSVHLHKDQNAATALAVTNDTDGSSAYSGYLIDGHASTLYMLNHAPGRSLTRYGLTLGGWIEISEVSGDADFDGIVIGTQASKPIVLGTNNSERARIDSTGKVGFATTGPDKPVEINAATGGAIRLTYNDSNGGAADYTDFSVDADGDLTVTSTGDVYFDATNGDFGFGTATPAATVHSLSTTEQLRLGYDASNYGSFTVGTDGDVTISTVDSDGAEGDINLAPNGYVGILTPIPTEMLELTSGNILLDGAGSVYMKIDRGNNTASDAAIWYYTAGTSTWLAGTTINGGTSGDESYRIVDADAGPTYTSRFSIADGGTITLGDDQSSSTVSDVVVTAGDLTLGDGAVASAVETVATLGVGATTFAVDSNVSVITGDGGGNTVATITGGVAGQTLVLLFTDTNVTITDTDAHTANTVDLSAAFTSADDTTLTLVFDGTSWYEISRSVN